MRHSREGIQSCDSCTLDTQVRDICEATSHCRSTADDSLLWCRKGRWRGCIICRTSSAYLHILRRKRCGIFRHHNFVGSPAANGHQNDQKRQKFKHSESSETSRQISLKSAGATSAKSAYISRHQNDASPKIFSGIYNCQCLQSRFTVRNQPAVFWTSYTPHGLK